MIKWFGFLLCLCCVGGIFAATHKVQIGMAPNKSAELVSGSHAGDTLCFSTGVHRVSHLYINKHLVITGDNGAILDGGGQPVLYVTADSVDISHLVLRNVSTSYIADHAALRFVKCTGGSVKHCRFEYAFFGVYLEKAGGITISNNRFISNSKAEAASGNGIHLWYSEKCIIRNNIVEGHRDGIYLEFASSAIVEGNTSKNNLRYGLHFMFSHDNLYTANLFENNGAGVAVMYSKRVVMTRNVFVKNWGQSTFGLLLKDLKDSRLEYNLFRENSVAIHADNLERMEISRNRFVQNGWALRMRSNCRMNIFTQNDFAGNTFDVSSPTSQTENTFNGNYWSHYRGYDLDRDGIGDVPYRPVSLFSYLAVENSATLLLLRSFVMELLDMAEQIFPTLTPSNLADNSPLMKPVHGRVD